MASVLAPDFVTSVEAAGDHFVVRLVGELDLYTVDRLRDATSQLIAQGHRLRFDLTTLDFIDSTGLKYFVDLLRAARRDGLIFELTRSNPSVMRTFEWMALDTELPWVRD